MAGNRKRRVNNVAVLSKLTRNKKPYVQDDSGVKSAGSLKARLVILG